MRVVLAVTSALALSPLAVLANNDRCDQGSLGRVVPTLSQYASVQKYCREHRPRGVPASRGLPFDMSPSEVQEASQRTGLDLVSLFSEAKRNVDRRRSSYDRCTPRDVCRCMHKPPHSKSTTTKGRPSTTTANRVTTTTPCTTTMTTRTSAAQSSTTTESTPSPTTSTSITTSVSTSSAASTTLGSTSESSTTTESTTIESTTSSESTTTTESTTSPESTTTSETTTTGTTTEVTTTTETTTTTEMATATEMTTTTDITTSSTTESASSTTTSAIGLPVCTKSCPSPGTTCICRTAVSGGEEFCVDKIAETIATPMSCATDSDCSLAGNRCALVLSAAGIVVGNCVPLCPVDSSTTTASSTTEVTSTTTELTSTTTASASTTTEETSTFTTTTTTTTTTIDPPQQTCEPRISNGGFEEIPDSSLYQQGITSGGWQLSGEVFFQSNTNNAYTTPFGQKFVGYYGFPSSTARISQTLNNVVVGINTLTYSYRSPSADTGGESCSLFVAYAGTPLDTITLSSSQREFVTKTVTATVLAQNGDLTFTWDCSTLFSGNEIDLLLDNISFAAGQSAC